MVTVIDRLKSQARILQRQANAGDEDALRRLDASVRSERPILRRHCLRAVARELGFDGWAHALAVLRGDDVRDFGTLLYWHGSSAQWNIWSASYDEARKIREDNGGYLLPYKTQFFIAESHFLESLGLDKDDPDWERIGRDWARPLDRDARARLYEKLIHARQRSLGLEPSADAQGQ